MVINGNGSKFQQWTASGAVATAAWVLVLILYCVFRAFGIEDPIIGQAFLLLTGLWVGNLTLAQGKKQAKTEETAKRAEAKAYELEQRADAQDVRSDDSERRETEWSKHRDHPRDEKP